MSQMKELLLAVFFDSTSNETNHLYVSFNGRIFRKIDVPYNDAWAGKTRMGERTAFRDPGMMYYDGKYWILNGDMVRDGTPNKYQPKWGMSKTLEKGSWSKILSGTASTASNNPISLACNVGGQTVYPYDKNGKLSNTKFDACGPDVFVDGSNIYMFLSAGYWGEWNGGKSEDDVMKQYLIKVKTLQVDANGTLQVAYEQAKMVNFPKDKGIVDERNIPRGGKEDRIDGSMYKENGYYYFAVKRYGTSYELWRIADLNNVSNESSWELLNSDFVYEYEGASLVKFKDKYLFYCDQLSDIHGIHVAITDRLEKDRKWKEPEAVEFVEGPGASPKIISRRHGTVLCIKDTNQIAAILKVYEKQYGTAQDETLNADMNNGWFRSNGKRYNLYKGTLRTSCEMQENGDWYWFDADGTMAKNKHVYIPNLDKWVYYTHTGKMAKGEMWIGKQHMYWDDPAGEHHWYYFDLVTGERAVSKFVYLPKDDKWVYYDGNGWMVYGEQYINGHWYYFYPDTGKMAKGTVKLPDGRIFHYDETTGIRD